MALGRLYIQKLFVRSKKINLRLIMPIHELPLTMKLLTLPRILSIHCFSCSAIPRYFKAFFENNGVDLSDLAKTVRIDFSQQNKKIVLTEKTVGLYLLN